MRPQLTVRRRTLAPSKTSSTERSAKILVHNPITTENLKLRPIISTCNTYFYETAKALSKSLAPLAENQHTIKNTLGFAEKLKGRTIN